ncbi:hypothetical protein [Sphingomonas segetis]|jgi:hypothetical protein|uniref:hypothetical protein n=1 Tax=Sphingomonas segetis TaxID=1104779 RepID=UPI0012D2B3F8|nr:hypothetical protein [Sphingomonas segetis]
MRKLLISTVAAVSALAVAAPAAAQYYPNRAVPAYGYGYGYNQGTVRALQVRVNRIQQDLRRLAQYRMISRGEYYNRQQDAREIERRLRRDLRDGRGFNAREFAQTQQRIARLEYKISRDVRDGRHYAFRW